MDSASPWREYTVLLISVLVFNTTSCLESSPLNLVNVSGDRRVADLVSGQWSPSSWSFSSTDAEPNHSTDSSHPQNRWQTQTSSSRTVYSFKVKEDTAPGTVVGKMDSLFEIPTPITYSVQEDDGENLFLLSPHSGEFLLSRGLDFEAQRFYILTVSMQQGDSQVSSVRVYFNVLDVNDNPPVFSQGTFWASLMEDAAVGTCFLSLNVSDQDDGDNGDIRLRVVGEDEEEAFYINSSGSLCLKTELDRERHSSYNLTVSANDCPHTVSLQLTSTARVNVVVEDINDNAPKFVSSNLVSIPEDSVVHSVVITVTAVDKDVGSSGEVLYYLKSTSHSLFSIDSRNGNIYLEEELDREQLETLNVTVTATDKGSPKMETTMNLTVLIEDVNDNEPEFLQSAYTLTLREDITRGTSLFHVQAVDRDVGKNGQVRYRLSQSGPFVIDSVLGVVTVMDKLDRETDSNYSMTVTATDQGTEPRSATAAVSVTVLDVNDFEPRFTPQTLSIHLLENEEDSSQLIHQVSAFDEDLGVNSQLTYSIQKGHRDGLFSITPNGTFQILQSLDREKEPSYFVTIIAVDAGFPPLTGTLTIHVIVDDINDNQPDFTEEVYNTIVSEDSPTGTVFAMITASDRDEGISGEIGYSLENHDVPFGIDEMSGELFTTNALDRETVAFYRLGVIGSDKHPNKPRSSSVLVTVLIGDVNDHWPQFMNGPYVAHVPTELAQGSIVCAVRAKDGDTEMNAELHYSLYGTSSDLFSIHPYSGTVYTSHALRRTEDIIVSVHVEDAGENPKFDITTISIRFQSISEFPEMKVDVLSYSLSEDDPVGTQVAIVSAASSRAEPVSFYLASGNFEDMFHMDQFSGSLSVENPLDYESMKEFTLLIEARDSGSAPYSSFEEIHINISDVNDNFPQFTQAEYRCEIFENSPPSLVCDVLAIDADSGVYSTVRYNITDGNTHHSFTIDPETGLLSTHESLDKEHIPEFSLTVEATDTENPLHKDKATVIIVVLDKNDNAPRFTEIFHTMVPEDSPVGHTILQVTCTDDDAGDNAIVNYSIINQSDDMPFDIYFTTGFITVKGLLDRETQDLYILRVNANDSAWSISTDVTIVVSDVNDNRPVFKNHSHKVFLPETKDKDVFVMQVLATDADIGHNGEILYVIEPPNEEFWVNASSGEIFAKQRLTLHNSAFEIYQFNVIAFDCGSDPLYSNASITVRLEPHNHHPPMFFPLKPLIALPYHMALGTEVIQFTAVDPDVTNSSNNIEYSLSGGNASAFFLIQSDNGKLMVKHSLVESVNLVFTLVVNAADQGFPSLSSQAEISFKITDRNQFSPRFREPDVTFSAPEDLSVGSVIGKIHAEDRDQGPNGAVTYNIIPQSRHLPFSVGEFSGLLTLIRQLDFERDNIYHIKIKASDGGWVAKTGILNVTVAVMDVNDNPPVFPYSEYTTSIPENAEIKTKVLDLDALDADSGVYAQISYSLIAGHVDGFAVDRRNGSITTLAAFDYEQEQIFDLTIKASNTGGHPLFSLAHVVIQIIDVNEFLPTFTMRDFHFSALKNVPVGTVVGKVTAEDGDKGSEGQVFYLMFGQNKHLGFEIDKLSGEIFTTRSLRKQGNSQVDLKVLAKNHGVITGLDVAEAMVYINVMDSNDAPEFTAALYFVNVPEDSPVGESVFTVSAHDQDSILDWNRVYFSIVNGNTNLSFAVDPSTGVIKINSPIDRELFALYNLTLTATDNGSPPATGTTYIIVTIDDVNDNAPKLTFTEAFVKENQPAGTVVARLNASDSDLPPNNGPFTYWLVNPSTDSTFSLTPNGDLSTTRTIDKELISTYQVLVAVSDAGIPQLSSSTSIHIKILDENDNPSMPRIIFIEVKYFGTSFEGGMIGNVHPEDPDESDIFNCAIKSGSHNMFTITNDTCELWSSPFQGEATFNITVEATDQLHFPVNNSIYVTYKGFTNASIDSCILFYLSSSSVQEFVSRKYLRFVKALDSLFNLQASKTHVFGIKHIGSEIVLLAAVKNYNGQYLSRDVASGISAGHKRLLEAQSNVSISHITGDPCFISPCQNGARCNKNIYISQEVAVLESSAVIFVSPQKEIFNCTCLAGFTGTLCELDMNECEVNPCQNKGTCVNTAGSFYCLCQSGFSGSFCSADGDECLRVKCHNGGTCIPSQDGQNCLCVNGFEGQMCERVIDQCASRPCVQGNCTNSKTGFACHCPFGVSGLLCEEHSLGFEELSFMEFPPLDRRINLISLEFASVKMNSLLVYNPGGSSSREFLALEILDGAAHLSYDLGSGPVRLHTHKQVADGNFHSITVRRIGNMASLHVDDCTDLDSSGFCFSQTDGSSLERTLDVSSNMTFGGLNSVEPLLLNPSQIKTHDFVGCVHNIYINGVLLRPSAALAAYNIHDKCPRVRPSPCHDNHCKNDGVCHDLWSHYVCECKSPFTGINCTKGLSEELVLQFNGTDYIEYVIKEQFKRDYLQQILTEEENNEKKWAQRRMSIKFKTREDGVLMSLAGQRGNIILKIKDGKPAFTYEDSPSGHMSEFTVEAPVADEDWHVVLMLGHGQKIVVFLDDVSVLNISDPSMDLTPVTVETLVLGGALKSESKLQYSGFVGCVQHFEVMGHSLPVGGHSMMADIFPSSSLLQSSCDSPDVCLLSPCSEDTDRSSCLSSHCRSRWSCGADVQNRSCICAHNISHHACGSCIPAAESRDGCSEAQANAPLWLIAVILPLFSILVIAGMCVFVCRARRRNAKCASEHSQQKTERGSDNAGFCFDDNRTLTADAGSHKQSDQDHQQRSNVEFYRDASLSGDQPLQNSEPEYYEIGSISSASHSGADSLQKHLNSEKCVKAEQKRWGDLRMLLAGFKHESVRDERAKSPTKTHKSAFLNKQLLVKTHAGHSQGKPPRAKMFSLQPELLEPAQYLTFEEISKLNNPPEHTKRSRPAQSSKDMVSRVTESKFRQFTSLTPDGPSQSELGTPGLLPALLKHSSQSAAGQHSTDRAPYILCEQWEEALNTQLPYSSYAPVFEDMARLSTELNQSCDIQSDIEEII